jgi:hypothetical protein
MRKHKRIFKRRAFAGRCPTNGGTCFNPFCALGCIEDIFG